MGGATLGRIRHKVFAVGVAMLLMLALAIPVGAAHPTSDAELYGGGSSDADLIGDPTSDAELSGDGSSDADVSGDPTSDAELSGGGSSDADVSGDPIDGEIDSPLSPLPDLGFTFGPVAGAGQQASGASALIVSLPPTPLAILNIEVGGVTVGSAPGYDGQILGSDDVIETGLASEATVVFFDASVLQLGPGTRIQLSEVRRPGESRGEITVFQWIGSTWSVVTSFTDSQTRYQVETPAAVGIVRGTEFMTQVMADGRAKFGVVAGEVQVTSNGGATAAVTPGSGVEVSADPDTGEPSVGAWQPDERESRGLGTARGRHKDARSDKSDGNDGDVAHGRGRGKSGSQEASSNAAAIDLGSDGANVSWDGDADGDVTGNSSGHGGGQNGDGKSGSGDGAGHGKSSGNGGGKGSSGNTSSNGGGKGSSGNTSSNGGGKGSSGNTSSNGGGQSGSAHGDNGGGSGTDKPGSNDDKNKDKDKSGSDSDG